MANTAVMSHDYRFVTGTGRGWYLMPFRYRCTEDGCDFDHFSPGLTSAHEGNTGHDCETYSVDQDDGYNWQGQEVVTE